MNANDLLFSTGNICAARSRALYNAFASPVLDIFFNLEHNKQILCEMVFRSSYLPLAYLCIKISMCYDLSLQNFRSKNLKAKIQEQARVRNQMSSNISAMVNVSNPLECANYYDVCAEWPRNCSSHCSFECCLQSDCIFLSYSANNNTSKADSNISRGSSNSSSVFLLHQINSTTTNKTLSTVESLNNSCSCVTLNCLGQKNLVWAGSTPPNCTITCSLPADNTSIISNASGRNCSLICCGATPQCATTGTTTLPLTTAASDKAPSSPSPAAQPPTTSPPPASSSGNQVVVRNNITVVNITTVVTEYVHNGTTAGAQDELNRLIQAFRRFHRASAQHEHGSAPRCAALTQLAASLHFATFLLARMCASAWTRTQPHWQPVDAAAGGGPGQRGRLLPLGRLRALPGHRRRHHNRRRPLPAPPLSGPGMEAARGGSLTSGVGLGTGSEERGAC